MTYVKPDRTGHARQTGPSRASDPRNHAGMRDDAELYNRSRLSSAAAHRPSKLQQGLVLPRRLGPSIVTIEDGSLTRPEPIKRAAIAGTSARQDPKFAALAFF
ncbi:hypothetical protein [Bradyrhizobium genosp. P]|uniref:hypothetical protein n=1 Tax=Bradyrhizobium genosp. P TaxID=83641 RepID=UPI003CE792ED